MTDDNMPTSETTRRRFLRTTGLIGVAAVPTLAPATEWDRSGSRRRAAAPAGSLFSHFVGTCQAGTDPGVVLQQQGIRWERQDVSWDSLERQPGVIDQGYLDDLHARLDKAAGGGVTVLPMLGYTAHWAARTSPYTFSHAGSDVEIGPMLSETETSFVRDVTVTAPDGKSTTTRSTLEKSKTPPRDSAEWKAFVDRVAGELRNRHGLEYFQVWNEACWGSGFWNSGLGDYFSSIHKPAAEAIRSHGAKVVYGGWPAMASATTYADALTDNDAWSSVDVFDLHYHALGDMDALRQAGHAHLGTTVPVWQTEWGFDTDGTAIPNNFPRAFYWGLHNGLAAHPDRFKMFWFAWWAPDDPAAYGYRRCLRSDSTASAHGAALATLLQLLDTPSVQRYTDFTTTPALSPSLAGAAVEGFALPNGRKILAIHLRNDALPDSVRVTLGRVGHVAPVERVSIFNGRTPLTFQLGTTTVDVPVHDPDGHAETINASSGERTFYLSVGL